jgi:hypothetical protein
MCAMHTGVIVLQDHLARQMGTDLDADTTRIGLAMVDLYAAMGEFAASDTGKQMTDPSPNIATTRKAIDDADH